MRTNKFPYKLLILSITLLSLAIFSSDTIWILLAATLTSTLFVTRSKKFKRLYKELKNKLKKKNETTSETLREREGDLRQSQKMIAIGHLAGGAAHDFNNKLSAILMTGSLLKRELEEGSKSFERVTSIMEIAEQAADLNRQLLTFSKKKMLNIDIYSVNDLVFNSIKILKPLIREDIHFEVKVDENLGNIRVDPTQMSQILINLVVNARDAMPKGGTLQLETLSHELTKKEALRKNLSQGTYACIRVRDNGTGMDTLTQEKIFEPFYTTKDEDEGTGLGLYTVDRIVKQCGGYISVYSEPHQGATFEIYFPIVSGMKNEIHNETSNKVHITGTGVILLAEDEIKVREATKEALEEHGFTVISAKNGAEALQQFIKHQNEIDIIVTDVVMPDLSGKDFVESVSKMNPQVPVIFTSGYSNSILSDLSGINNPYSFMQKPVDATKLLKELVLIKTR